MEGDNKRLSNTSILEGFQEFDVLELEEARSRQHDPSSRSRRFCFGSCILGPQDKQAVPILSVTLFAVACLITILLTFIVYKKDPTWKQLGYSTTFFGLSTLILMFCVMCSDPGIQTRDKLLQIA